MAIFEQNKNHVSWLGTPAEVTIGDTGLTVLRGSMLTLAGIVGVSLAIALDPIMNLFA